MSAAHSKESDMAWPPSSTSQWARFLEFLELPEEIQTDMLERAAVDLASRFPLPVPTGLIRVSQSAAFLKRSFRMDPESIELGGFQELLSLCRATRAAGVSTQVIQLRVVSEGVDDILMANSGPRVPRFAHGIDGTSTANGPSEARRFDDLTMPPVPLFEGATRDVILTRPSLGPVGCDAAQLLTYVAHVLGSNVRRIYLQNDAFLFSGANIEVTSQRTGRTYSFGLFFGEYGVDSLVDDIAPGLERLGNGRKPGPAGEFDDQEARAFVTLARQTGFPRTVQKEYHGEVIRHTRDGTMLVNDGVKGELTKNWPQFPTDKSKNQLRKLFFLARHVFPELEYISVLTTVKGGDVPA